MSKRAGIYIRVSSEKQAEPDKVSPQEQEKDCQELCKAKGYEVVAVYKDTERYRVGGRLVEPSGTRADRPGIKAMLTDARAAKLDVIVGWREDRLYRGYRPMLDILDCIEETKIDVDLAKETFDKRMMGVKVWVAKMELDARRDRTAMGVGARFSEGKVWQRTIPYGYRKGEGGRAEENPDEAKWVRLIWEWKAERRSFLQIRQRLLEGSAPQRQADKVKIAWNKAQLKKILHNPVYYTGIQKMRWGDKEYEIPYPVLVDPNTARRVIQLREEAKQFPARHVKHNYLALGLVYCVSCGLLMSSYTSRSYGRNGKRLDCWRCLYRCTNAAAGYASENCPHQVNVRKLDAELWEKVLVILNDTTDLEHYIQEKIDELRLAESDAQMRIERIKDELAKITEERQWVITQARKKSITEKDMDKQLAALSAQGDELRRELDDKSLLIGSRAERLIEFANRYRAELRGRLEWLKREGNTPEQAQRIFDGRRELVLNIVRRVNVFKDKSIKVEFQFDLPGDGEIKDPPASSPDRASSRR